MGGRSLDPKRPVLLLLTSHWVSLLGAALVTTAGFSWLFVLPLHLRGGAGNPYIGLVAFIGIPIVFFAGLALIPVGIFLAKRHIAPALAAANRRVIVQRLVLFFGVMTVINIVIGSQITYRAVAHMETNQFCGQSCHVMKPEFTAHLTGPHQKVACVECHITPGAAGFVAAKIAGSRQLEEVTFNSFPRPIPSGLESDRLAPSVDTCEQCHSRERNSGSKLRIISKFKDDEANTPTKTVLMMSIGGGASAGGIHGAHMGPGVVIRYAAADAKRQTIPWVEYHNGNTGETRTYVAGDAKPAVIASMQHFEMECADCHNRPTHAFELPEQAVDRALAAGEIPTTLPYAKKTGVGILKAAYAGDDDAAAKIPAAFTSFYQQKYPAVWSKNGNDVSRGARAVLALYERNVFPDLKVTWGTYPNNLGHADYPGCFRCHDESHTTAAKKTISQDCNLCHNPLAVDETSPEVLKTLGLTK
jgi:nitrate/TMAO reductase-like tetraheme cytochrome c subunit